MPGPKGSLTPEDELHRLRPPCLSFPLTGGGECTGGARAGVTSTVGIAVGSSFDIRFMEKGTYILRN